MAPFCLAKYEMKISGVDDGSSVAAPGTLPESRASGTPWTGLTRDGASELCRSLGAGYELISNAEWQAVARGIETVAWNWAGAEIGERLQGLSTGHTAGDPPRLLDASTNDDDSCHGLPVACSRSVFHPRRRVQQLANGSLLWDLSGNAQEWIKDDRRSLAIGGSLCPDQNVSSLSRETVCAGVTIDLKTLFGPEGEFAASDPPGLGYAWLNYPGAVVLRGDDWNGGHGIFSVTLKNEGFSSGGAYGFRCAFHP